MTAEVKMNYTCIFILRKRATTFMLRRGNKELGNEESFRIPKQDIERFLKVIWVPRGTDGHLFSEQKKFLIQVAGNLTF